MRPIFLNAREAIARAEGRLGCVVRPVKEPPPEWLIAERKKLLKAEAFYPQAAETYYEYQDESYTLKCPWLPGDVVPLKEAWGIFDADPETRAVGYYDKGEDGECVWYAIPEMYFYDEAYFPQDDKRQPAITMPSWAVRHHPTVKSVKCVRVDSISEDTWVSTGFERVDVWNVHTAEWLSRYPAHPWETSHAFIIKFEESK